MGISERFSTSFCPLFWISQVLGVSTCALAVYHGSAKGNFNWHIVVTTVGMVYIFGFKLLTYRMLRWLPIQTLHLLHACAGLTLIVATVLGYLTAYSRIKRQPGALHFATMHDWIAATSTLLFVTQWLFSVTAYVYPKLSVNIRVNYVPAHILIGHVTFVLVVVAALLGLSELARMEDLEKASVICMGFLMLGFSILVVCLSTTESYKRLPLDIDS